jgi:hypothetical protein
MDKLTLDVETAAMALGDGDLLDCYDTCNAFGRICRGNCPPQPRCTQAGGPARAAAGLTPAEQASELLQAWVTLLQTVREQGTATPEQQTEYRDLWEALRAIVGTDPRTFWAQAIVDSGPTVEAAYTYAAPERRLPFVAFQRFERVEVTTVNDLGRISFRTNVTEVNRTTRGIMEPFGQFQLFPPAPEMRCAPAACNPEVTCRSWRLEAYAYDPVSRRLGRALGFERTGRFGGTSLIRGDFAIFGMTFGDLADVAPDDADGDGLPDLAEEVFGTELAHPDSDRDGILDGAEVEQGLDPLDGRPSALGVIGSVPLPGEAVDVAAFNDRVLVALREGGVGVVEVGSGRLGVLAAQLTVPGEALNVALNQDFGVAGGTFPGALVFDPRTPVQTVRRLDFGARVTVTAAWVEASQGWFALSNGELRLVDLATGTELDRTLLTGAIHDLAAEAGVIVGVTAHELLTFRQEAGAIVPLGRTSLGLDSPDPVIGRRRVTVGGGVAFVADLVGFGRFRFDDPTRPEKLSNSRRYGPVSFKQILPNGSGAGLAIVGGSPVPPITPAGHNVQAFDLSDPAVNDAARDIYPTPGVAQAGSLYHNFAYVADGRAGLQIVNYLPGDTGTNPPSITLRTGQAEGRAEAGQPLRLQASVSDDVQVRRVEFYLDGARLAADGNFPFEVTFTAPPRTAERTVIRVRAKATDTAGNETLSDEISLELVPDATPPRVVRSVPGVGALLPALSSVLVFFNEAILPDSVTETTVQLLAAGADGQVGTADDLAMPNLGRVLREEPPSLAVTTATPLVPGRYRLRLAPPLADLAGNPLAAAETVDLVVFDPTVDTDGDGLPDDVERLLGLDPLKADTDGNGVPDGAEDPDRDGLTSAFEIAFGTDPRRADSDGDGLNDGDEDVDRDGLSARRELAAGTDPLRADSDGDGWPDEGEVTGGSDPLNPLSQPFVGALGLPPVELVAPAAVFGPGSAFGPTLAHPPVEIIAPAAVFGEGSAFGPTLANPPVEVLAPAAVFGPGSAFGPTLANPPAEVIAPAAVFGPGSAFGPTLANPPAEVIAPAAVFGAGSAFGPTLAQPPVEILAPAARFGPGGDFGPVLAQPPATVEFLTQ